MIDLNKRSYLFTKIGESLKEYHNDITWKALESISEQDYKMLLAMLYKGKTSEAQDYIKGLSNQLTF